MTQTAECHALTNASPFRRFERVVRYRSFIPEPSEPRKAACENPRPSCMKESSEPPPRLFARRADYAPAGSQGLALDVAGPWGRSSPQPLDTAELPPAPDWIVAVRGKKNPPCSTPESQS